MRTFGSLFAGIGGIDLGLERAGWKARWQVEIDEFGRRVLEKHWPDVARFRDVRAVGRCPAMGADALADAASERDRGDPEPVGCEVAADGSKRARFATVAGGGGCAACGRFHLEPVDLIAGGFPCQDISVAGTGAGLSGARSSLWFEYLRILQELRPRWVLVENVPALRTRGIDTVIDGLEAAGYSCWPLVVGARHVGAPHRRDRVWIVARLDDSASAGREAERQPGEHRPRPAVERGRALADAGLAGLAGRRGLPFGAGEEEPVLAGSGDHRWPSRPGEQQHGWEEPRVVHAASREVGATRLAREEASRIEGSPEPSLGSAVDGLSERLSGRHRRAALKALGNSVVPQVVEAIGRMIMEQEVNS